MHKRHNILIAACIAAVFSAVVAVVMSHLWCPMKKPEVFPRSVPTQVRVKVSGKVLPRPEADRSEVNVSAAVSVICGLDDATADRYEERNDALRSIARRRDIAQGDIRTLMAYVRATNDTLRVERTAALKNDILNLLRNQEPTPDGLAEMLIGMFNSGKYPAVVLDYCIQHLGALQNYVSDTVLRERINGVFVSAAKQIDRSYAGTALYSLADDNHATPAQKGQLRHLTVAACETNANPIVRIAAMQLAGQRNYCEVLPSLRKALSSPRRDAVVDIAAIGTLGLLGGADDLPLLERLRGSGGVRLRPAIDAAVRRISAKEESRK